MTLRSGSPSLSLPCAAVMASIVVAFSLLGTGTGWAQSAPPSLSLRGQPQPAQAPSSAAPTGSDRSGLVDELGRFFEKMSILPLKGASESRSDANAAPQDTIKETSKEAAKTPAKDGSAEAVRDAIKQSGETLSRLTKPSSVVSGRTVCPMATNGTPDCQLAAEKLCRGKGYKEGKSLNTDAAETCSAKVLIPGRQRKPDDCRTDTYVTSALCQ